MHQVSNKALRYILEQRGATINGEEISYTLPPAGPKGSPYHVKMKTETLGAMTRVSGEVLDHQISTPLLLLMALPSIGVTLVLLLAALSTEAAIGAQLKTFITYLFVPIIFVALARMFGQLNRQHALERFHLWLDDAADAARRLDARSQQAPDEPPAPRTHNEW
jgi:hypothetical protein